MTTTAEAPAGVFTLTATRLLQTRPLLKAMTAVAELTDELAFVYKSSKRGDPPLLLQAAALAKSLNVQLAVVVPFVIPADGPDVVVFGLPRIAPHGDERWAVPMSTESSWWVCRALRRRRRVPAASQHAPPGEEQQQLSLIHI